MSRVYFHIDLNAFFASCEELLDPSLKGKPLVVGGKSRRSVISTANYEARKYGIHSAMPMQQAEKLCKDLVIVNGHYAFYSDMSNQFMQIIHSYTDLVEKASIDECYADMTDVICRYPKPLDVAFEIQRRVLEETGLRCSIGIGPNMFLAKMASDMKKPLGITVLRKREIDKYMWPLPITDMFGVGKKTAPKLQSIKIETIGDLAKFSNYELLSKTVGEHSAKALINLANGNDESEVCYLPSNDYSSVSNAQTFDSNIYDSAVVKNTLKVLCGTVSYKLESTNRVAKTVGILVRYGDFQSFNKSKGLEKGISSSSDIYDIIEDLFDDYCKIDFGVRLVTVYAQRISESKEKNQQISMFDDMTEIEKEEEVKKILNQVKNKFGSDVIKKGYYSYKKD